MLLRMKGLKDGRVIHTTSFDYEGIKTCNAAAFIQSDFHIFRDISRFLRDPEDGLDLHAFDLIARDRFAKYYLRGCEAEVKTLELTCEDHQVPLVVLIHNAEIIIPERFHGSRKKEEEFHKERMLNFVKVSKRKHPRVRFQPIYIRIVNEGKTLEFVSFEGLLYGRTEKILWRIPFSLRNVESCKYLLSICLDFRFRKESFDFVLSCLKVPYYHLLGTPGSCKGIVDGDETALETVERALRGGATEGIILQHAGCKAYEKDLRGLSPYEEEEYQKDQIKKGKAILKKMGLKEVFASYIRLVPQNLIEFVVVR